MTATVKGNVDDDADDDAGGDGTHVITVSPEYATGKPR